MVLLLKSISFTYLMVLFLCTIKLFIFIYLKTMNSDQNIEE